MKTNFEIIREHRLETKDDYIAANLTITSIESISDIEKIEQNLQHYKKSFAREFLLGHNEYQTL